MLNTRQIVGLACSMGGVFVLLSAFGWDYTYISYLLITSGIGWLFFTYSLVIAGAVFLISGGTIQLKVLPKYDRALGRTLAYISIATGTIIISLLFYPFFGI